MARPISPRNEASRWDEDSIEPWLEEAEEDEGPTHTLVGRRTFWILLLLALVLLIGVAAGIWLISGREKGAIDIPPPGAELPLVRSSGPWKEPPPEGPAAAGIPVEGQGQILFGTGDGREAPGRIAVEQLPEAPIERPRPAPEPAPPPAEGGPTDLLPENLPEARNTPPAPEPAPPPKPKPAPTPPPAKPKTVDTIVPREAPAPKPAPAPAPKPAAAPAPSAPTGSTVQLGAFSTEARARAAWKTMTTRFSYLAGNEPIISATERDGKTLYRLRVPTANTAAARDICGRLKVAGEGCTVVD